MREIEFRAWDKKNKCWFKQENPQGNPLFNHFISFDGWLWKEDYINSNDSEKNDSLAKSEFELSQYTGLKDKNGVKIFEGDIVKILIGSWISKHLGTEKQKKMTLDKYLDSLTEKYEVVFKEGKFVGKNKENYSKLIATNHGYIEIIGNIYQDKNLLEE